MKATVICLLFVSLLTIPLAGESDSFKKSFELEAGKPVKLIFTDVDGDIAITGKNQNSINFEFFKELKGHPSEGDRDYFDKIEPEIEFKDNLLNIKIKYPKKQFKLSNLFRSARITVRSKLTVPITCDQKILAVDGNINVRKTKGLADLRTVDGKIDIAGCDGEINLKSVDGDIKAADCVGSIKGGTTDGDIEVEGTLNRINLKSVDGSVTIVLQPGSRLTGDGSLSSVDGDLELIYPADFGFIADVRSGDGEIDIESKFDNIEIKKKNKFKGTRAKGEHTIKMNTVDGDISLTEK